MALTTIGRQLLGEPGLALDDGTYAQAVAALGAARATWSSRAWGPQQDLCWTPRQFRKRAGHLETGAPLRWLLRRGSDWRKQVAATPGARLLLPTWEFDADAPDLAAIARILGHPAVGVKSVLVETRAPDADLRWQWPLRVSGLPGDVDEIDLEGLRHAWPSGSLVEVWPLGREHARCEILVVRGSVRGGLRRVLGLRHRVRAGHLVVFGPLDVPWADMRAHVEALLAETQAAAISIVPAAPASAPALLNELVRELSHNEPYDLALARAFPRESSLHVMDLRLVDAAALTSVAMDLGRRLRRLPHDVPLALPPGTAGRIARGAPSGPWDLATVLTERARSLPFDRESQGGTALSEIAVAERQARREAGAAETPRFLQARLFVSSEGHLVGETRGLILGREHVLDVFIGPREAEALADVAFPEGDLDWQGRDSLRLQVLLVEPGQWDDPIGGTLDLPRTGRSTTCRLVFSPTTAGRFEGRVIVHYRGRVLQTALLGARVFAGNAELDALDPPPVVHFAVETFLRRSLGTLDDRRRFDACVVTNRGATGTPSMAAAATNGAYVASLDTLAPQLAAINGLLNQIAFDARPYQAGLLSGANAKLLCELAAHGSVLYRRLVRDYIDRSSAARALRASEYLQIVSTDPDAIVPFEFVYEYPPPAEGAPVCPNAVQALREGRCPESCVPRRSPAPHVCPLGFWGLSKVIERHVHVPDLPHPAIVLCEPVGGRDALSLSGPTLLAASEQVPAASLGELAQTMRAVWGDRVDSVATWVDWRQAVESHSPVLLLAMPHADGAGTDISLEISGDVLKSIYIDESYVRGHAPQPPVVVLLGCDTANVAYADAYVRHIGVFRQDAALVLGTIATVLAEDAAKVATQLVRRLGETLRGSTERFGEVLRQVKREAVADSVMTAMCVVAFGDADWRLK